MQTSVNAPAGAVEALVPPGSPSSRLPLVADLATVAAVVTLFYCLFLFEGYTKLFRDSDAGWHIRAGDLMLASGRLLRTDPFSFTAGGTPWFAWEWLADLTVALIHRAFGLAGVASFYAAAIAGGVWLWFRLHWAVGGNLLIACFLAPPMLSTTNLHWLARPHVLSWLFLLGFVFAAERLAQGAHFGRRQALLLAVASFFWTNLHGSFFLGPVILGLYALGSFLSPLLWNLDRALYWARARAIASASLTAAAATLLNPYGLSLHQHVVRYLADPRLLDRIGEFQSFNFHAEGAGQILLALGISAGGAVLALGQRHLGSFFLSAFLLVTALRSARALPLVALLSLPLANAALTEALVNARALRPALRRQIDGFLRYSDRLRALDRRCRGFVWAPVALALCFALLRTPAIAAATGFPTDQFPVAASSAVAALPPNARILAPDKFGGYLIYRFAGKRKVFFDGRSDFYGARFLEQYGRLVQVRPGWEAILDGFDFSHALLPNDYSLVPALEKVGWTPIYHDRVATLLIRPRGRS